MCFDVHMLYKALQDVTESHWKLWEACYSSHKVLTERKLFKVHIINVKAEFTLAVKHVKLY